MMEFLRQRAFVEFLKESTFAVNEVMIKSWHVTKRNYFSIATLCFLMFITASVSTIMSGILSERDFFLRLSMLVIFVLLYFTLNLILFRYIFHLLDDEDNDIKIVETIPTKTQIISFLIGSVLFLIAILLVLLITVFIPFTFFYLLLKIGLLTVGQKTFNLVSNIFIFIGVISSFIAFLRLSFFLFFIIDKKTNKFKFSEYSFKQETGGITQRTFTYMWLVFKHAFISLKLSLAITKGNLTKLLILLAVLGVFGYLYSYLTGTSAAIPGKTYIIILIVSIISFIIVPLTSVALTIAYRKMMSEYEGEEHPDIIHNIV